MKAIVVKKQGSPEFLELRDISKPVPKDLEILIKVHASRVTRGDVILRKLHPLMYIPMQFMGIKRKKTSGHEFAGEVVKTGKSVTKFRVGQKVFGTTTGLSVGANAEYVCLPESWRTGIIARMPNNASFEEAAALPIGGMTALEILKRGHIKPQQKVLINGASGSVGSYAVQLAKKYYVAKVTGICSTKNVPLAKSLGADEVIDHTMEDLTKRGQTYDVIIDTVGNITVAVTKKVLVAGGIFLNLKTPTKETRENLELLVDLFESGKIKVIVDSKYPLEQVVDAHRKVETGHKVGNVIISVIPGITEGVA